jgi:hypothetical protein
MEKNRELLSLLLQLKDDQEHNGNDVNLINKAIAIVEDTIRYRRAFFTEE